MTCERCGKPNAADNGWAVLCPECMDTWASFSRLVKRSRSALDGMASTETAVAAREARLARARRDFRAGADYVTDEPGKETVNER